MSIAADLIREAEERRPKPPPQPQEKRRGCMGENAKRNPCTRPPAIQGRICAECWRGMQRRRG